MIQYTGYGQIKTDHEQHFKCNTAVDTSTQAWLLTVMYWYCNVKSQSIECHKWKRGSHFIIVNNQNIKNMNNNNWIRANRWVLSRALHWLKINERIEHKLMSLTYKVLTTSQHDYLYNLISVQSTGRTRSSSLVTLARPSVSSSLQITNRSFTNASPYLWNQLPSSFRQPHSVHCPPGSPHHAPITSSQSPPSLSSPLPFTPDLKKLISFTNPFLHSHFYSFRTAFMDLNLYCFKGALLFVLVSGYVC